MKKITVFLIALLVLASTGFSQQDIANKSVSLKQHSLEMGNRALYESRRQRIAPA